MTIMEGKQGLMKSTAIKALFDPWFTDEIEQLGTKDASMQVAGVWGIEVSELDAMSKAEVSKVKAFLTRTTDRFRPPYGRRVTQHPRGCIFIGSTNSSNYLKDETGARRFLPVKVTKIDIEGLRRDRDQLWAEARVLYEAKTLWWFTSSDEGIAAMAIAEEEQEARYQADAWERPIASYLDSRIHSDDSRAYQVAVEAVFQNALDIKDRGRWDQAAMNRIARCMQRLGWVKKRVTIEDKRIWMYTRVPTENELKKDREWENIKVRNEAAARPIRTAMSARCAGSD
jgi:predicted P-loop ATPase